MLPGDSPAFSDGAQELFTTLMMALVPDLSDSSREAKVDITIGDVLGPLKMEKTTTGEDQRDANFSLLSYSFNLNSAMRGHLASVRSSHLTESELEPSDAKHTSATDPSLRLPHSKGTQEYVRVRQEDMKRRQSTLQFFCNT